MKNILCRDINGDAHIVAKKDLVRRISTYGVVKNGKGILLVRDRTSTTGRWDLPGGGVECGESLLEALTREMLEETGLRIVGRPKKICSFNEYFYDIESENGWESTRHFYEVRCKGDAGLNGNYDDIVDACYLKMPLQKSKVSSVAFMITKLLDE